MSNSGAILLGGSPECAKARLVSQYDFASRDFSIDIAFYCEGSGPLISQHDGTLGWSLSVVSGQLQFKLNSLTYGTTISNLSDSNWHVVRVCVDRTAQFAFVFVDGVLDGTLAIVGEPSVTNANPLLVGVSGGTFFSGGIAEIRLSTRVRATGTYQLDVRQYVDDAFTVGLFHFNEGAGQIAYDMSETRNDLYLLGSVTQPPLPRHTKTFLTRVIEGPTLDLPLDGPRYALGPFEVSPVTVVREHVWRALDISVMLSQFLIARHGKKYKYREGDIFPSLLSQTHCPALTVIPATMPDIKPETSAFHRVMIPMQLEGWLYHREVSEIEFFWWICLRAIFASYMSNTTAGRFNYINIQNMYSRGPSYMVQTLTDKPATAQSTTYFSNFRDILMFEVRQDLLGKS